MHRLLERQLKKYLGRSDGLAPELGPLLDAVSAAYDQGDNDCAMVERSMELSSHELFARNQELAEAESKYRAIFENATEGIFQATAAGQYIAANSAMARICGYDDPRTLKESITNIGAQVYVDCQRRAEILAEIGRHGSIGNWESQIRRPDGSTAWISETARAVRDAAGTVLYYEGTAWDITVRKQAESEREELQRRLIALSRQAGMSEVATGVLHNVGNVLNSINVSSALVAERLRASKIASVAKMTDLLISRKADIAHFVSEDEKGKQIPDFLCKLAAHLLEEQQSNLQELAALEQNVEHVKRIIAMQQAHAKGGGMTELVKLPDLIEDAIRINLESLERHRVIIVRRLCPSPSLLIDKHQVIQILINLIGNAKQAMRQIDGERRLTIDAAPAENDTRVIIKITDLGVGIAPEHLTRIFSHGFTTKSDGHGFGLHSAALAAQQMGGSLTASSDGPGAGATFTLELPLRAAPPQRKVA